MDQRLVKIPFPDPNSNTANDLGSEITITLPETIYMSEDTAEVKIAIWDDSQQVWSQEHTGEVAAFNFE